MYPEIERQMFAVQLIHADRMSKEWHNKKWKATLYRFFVYIPTFKTINGGKAVSMPGA